MIQTEQTFRLVLSILTFAPSLCNTEVVSWTTPLGSINGIKQYTANREVIYQFKGIPYAQPPVNELRFRKPRPAGNWQGTLNATAFGPTCLQLPILDTGRENCLYLNVFVPRNLTLSAKRAVMVWIHGGGFTVGSSNDYDGSPLALHGDVIVVTINYRLNVFGFFSTGDDVFRGNYGMWDQQQAFKWVKSNIQAYGGDPERITIFGQSAGGISVGLHTLIPSNVGLFHRVIAESGTSLGPRDFGEGVVDVSREIISRLNCSGVSRMECLKNVGARQLVAVFGEAFKHVKNKGFTILSPTGPRVDGDMFPQHPLALLNNPQSTAMSVFKSIDYLAGENTGDAGLFYFDILAYQSAFNFDANIGIPTSVLCNNLIPPIVQQMYDNCIPLVQTLCTEYTPQDSAPTLNLQTQLVAAWYNDIYVNHPTEKTLDVHASNSHKNTFQYLFSYKPVWGPIETKPAWLKGPNHADEVPFVFGLKTMYPPKVNIPATEFNISSRFMDYWTNFAKSGNPNGATTNVWPMHAKDSKQYLDIAVTDPLSAGLNLGRAEANVWPMYTNDSKQYLDIDVNDTSSVDLYQSRMNFWDRTVPNIMSSCTVDPILIG